LVAQADDVQCPSATTATVTLDGSLSNPGNDSTNIDRDLSTGLTEVYNMVTRVYYVDLNADGVPALFRRTDTAAPVELVTGVETMQIRYGVDTDGDGFANLYRDADTVTDWSAVVMVKVALLVRSVDPVKGTAEAMRHCLLGDPMSGCAGGEGADSINTDNWTDTNDAFLHQVYTSSIVFRNRIPVL
jgi:type IV pilus assembly protein PilW